MNTSHSAKHASEFITQIFPQIQRQFSAVARNHSRRYFKQELMKWTLEINVRLKMMKTTQFSFENIPPNIK